MVASSLAIVRWATRAANEKKNLRSVAREQPYYPPDMLSPITAQSPLKARVATTND